MPESCSDSTPATSRTLEPSSPASNAEPTPTSLASDEVPEEAKSPSSPVSCPTSAPSESPCTTSTSQKRSYDDLADSEDEEDGGRSRPQTASPESSSFDDGLRSCIVCPDDINTTFDDVHLSQSTFDALTFVMTPFRNPDAFTFGVLSRARTPGVLLYGPPGTGKSLAVRALAKETRATMITLTDADVRQMYVGEGEKKIQQVFQNARKNYPCIIFIDEADSIFGSRTASNGRASSNIGDLNQFLIEIDGIKSDPTRSPMIIAATNRPDAMDEGIVRRLGMRIMMDLPDVKARQHILSIHLKGEPIADDVNLDELAHATPDYTGSDLSNLVTAAARYAEQENMERIGMNGPSQKNDAATSHPTTRRLTSRKHFLRAKDEIRPAPITETMQRIREYHNKHGSTGYTGHSGARKVSITNKLKPLNGR